MIRQVTLTEAAEDDLVSVWLEISENSVQAADRFLDKVRASIALLPRHPNLGERDQRVGSVRRIIVGRYLVFYRADESNVRVLRVYHSARKIEGLRFTE